MKKFLPTLLLILFFYTAFVLFKYQFTDNFIAPILLFFPCLIYFAYYLLLRKENDFSCAIPFMVSCVAIGAMVIPFIGVAIVANNIVDFLPILGLILTICLISGFFSVGVYRDYLAILAGNTFGFGLIIFGTLFGYSKTPIVMYIFITLFYALIFAGYFLSKLAFKRF